MSIFQYEDLKQDYYKEIDILCHEEDDESFDKDDESFKKDEQTFAFCQIFDEHYDFSFQEELDKKYREEYNESDFIDSIIRCVFD